MADQPGIEEKTWYPPLGMTGASKPPLTTRLTVCALRTALVPSESSSPESPMPHNTSAATIVT